MHSKAKAATKDEKARMGLIRDYGCLPCWIETGMLRLGECHHIVEGNKRLGHSHTISLCIWHHRSRTELAPSYALELLGPPLDGSHGRKRQFIERYGTERQLLELQNRIIDSGEIRANVRAYMQEIGLSERQNRTDGFTLGASES